MSHELSRLAGPGCLDAGDALLLFRLLALWQRRRPTECVRGNRRKPRSRRRTPKPIAALESQLVQLGQVDPMLEWADRLAGGRDALVLLVVETALTEAHLAPHPSRSGPVETDGGAAWLAAAERGVAGVAPAARVDGAVVRYRVARQRSFAHGMSLPAPPTELAELPYARACAALKAFREGQAVPVDGSADAPGVLMMLPQLRTRGLVR